MIKGLSNKGARSTGPDADTPPDPAGRSGQIAGDPVAERAEGIDRSRGSEDDDADEVLWVTIEIPRGSRNKYEFDDALGRIRLDRTLHSSVHYPTDYGFIPDTLALDGDHLDVLVVVQEPTFPGCIVPARVIGMLDMDDEKGQDEKILAVPLGDPRFQDVHRLRDLPSHWLREIEGFFATYKLLEDKLVNVKGWREREAAWDTIGQCRLAFTRRRATPARDH